MSAALREELTSRLEGESEFTEAEYTKLKRKIDWILLPLMWWCYGIQQSDKTGLGNMNLFGLQADTGMVGKEYSYLTVLFYVSYAVFEFPFNYIMQRLNIGKTLSVFIFLWGIIVFAQAFLNNWAEFAALRFLQGMLECTISPGFNLIIARWYTAREHSSRSLVFQSANAGWGLIVDATVYGIAKYYEYNGGFAAWRGIELFLGVQTLICGVISWFFLGTASEVRWLSHREQTMANARIMRNHAGTDLTGKSQWKWDQVRECFVDPVMYFQFINTFLCCVMNGALTTFGTVVFQGFGFDVYQTVLYDIPRNVVSVLWFVMVGWTSLRWSGIRMYWMIFSTIVAFITMLVLALLPTDPSFRWTKMVMYWFTAVFVIPTFSAWALISSNTGGRTKFSVMSALTFIAYCTGNIAGSQVMQPSDAPHYLVGTTDIAICMGIDVIITILWRVYLVWMNKRRAREVAAMNITAEEAERRGQELGARDVTDLKNPFFVYSM